MLFQPDRDMLRQFYFNCWAKHLQQQALEPLEQQVVAVILDHPEYHDIFAQPERYQQQDYLPEMGVTNPFLHLSMHLVIRDQVAIDKPSGVRSKFEQHLHKSQDAHTSEHAFIDCLGEVMWQAERQGQVFDEAVYLDLLHGL